MTKDGEDGPRGLLREHNALRTKTVRFWPVLVQWPPCPPGRFCLLKTAQGFAILPTVAEAYVSGESTVMVGVWLALWG